MARFVIRILAITALIALITYIGSQKVWWNLPTYWIEILVFLPFMTVVIFNYLSKLRHSQPETFTQFYLLSIVVKMVAGLVLISVIVYTNPSEAVGNVTLFIISYLILTFMEVFYLMGNPTR